MLLKYAVTSVPCRLVVDGDQWMFLIGEDLQNGIAGFGDTIPEALNDLAKNIKEAS